MRKLKLLFILLIGLFCKGQDNTLITNINNPVSLQTGTPEISFPLASLPASKDLTINFGLSYNVNSYKRGNYSGIIAMNWMLTGNYTIKRQIISGLPDEIPTMYPEPWDDIYYYNLNGEQGSFKFEKIGNHPNDVYKIIKLTPNNVIIEHDRKKAPWSNWVNSFTIKDSKGYTYYFTDHDQNMTFYDSSAGTRYPEYQRDTFYVTRIEDAKSRTVASFINKKYVQYRYGTSNTVEESFYYLPEKIKTAYGNISFEHETSNNYSNHFPFQDSWFIKSITLSDKNDSFVSKNNLFISTKDDSNLDYIQTVNYYRVLNSIQKVDRNANVIDRINLGYKTHSYVKFGTSYSGSETDAYDRTLDLLYAVNFSNGKRIEYEFKSTKYPFSGNMDALIRLIKDPGLFVVGFCFLNDLGQIPIDTKRTKIYYLPSGLFKHNPETKLYVDFDRTDYYPNGNTDGPPLKPGEDSSSGNLPVRFDYIVVDPVTGKQSLPVEEDGRRAYVITPGHNVYLQVLGSGGLGNFQIHEKDYQLPTNNILLEEKGNPVVDSIKYYTKTVDLSQNYSEYELKKFIKFDYDLFDGSGSSSGVIEKRFENETIVYKNLKITESDKKGYTKYYFKSPSDYPPDETNESNIVWPNYSLTKNGLKEKKEIYDDQHNIRYEEFYSYVFPPYDSTRQYLFWPASMGNYKFYTTESYFEKVITRNVSHNAGGNSLSETSEKTFNQANNNLMSEKRLSPDGIISETTYQYASEKNNTKLLGANMFSVPLEVTQKQNNIQIGKLETKYDQSGNYFPSSVKSFGINNVVTGEQVNDFYDSMGNVLQTTSKSGVPTAIIWGYGNTQPIAKIEGARYADVLYILRAATNDDLDIVKRSNQDISSTDNTNEQLLRDALETFRRKSEFKNYLITTYTYDPLIGVKSMTSPNGFTEYYFYDNQNRMIRVEDTDHHIIKESKYEQNAFLSPF